MNHRNESVERLKSIVKEAVSEELRAEQETIRSKMSEEADKFFDLVDQALRLLREAHAMKKSFYIFGLEEIVNKLEAVRKTSLSKRRALRHSK